MKWRSLSLALPSLVLLLATEAGAQSDEQRAGARAAAQAGGQAFMERRYSDAVDLFNRAESLVHSPVHLLYAARSYEKLGKLVKAQETYIKITNDELPAGAPAPWKEAHADAEKELEALEPRIPNVSVSVQGAGSKPVTVTMDGAQVPSALIGVPRPVDPGDHRFEARAEGMETTTNTVTVKEHRNENIVLTLVPAGQTPPAVPLQTPATPPPASTAPAASGPPAAAPASGSQGLTTASSSSSSEAYSGSHGPTPLAYVAVGLGLVGVGVGTFFVFQSNNSVQKANDLCTYNGGTACPAQNASKINSYDDDARSERKIGTISLVTGGVLVGTGAILFAVTGKKKETAKGIHPWIGLGSAGMSGRF